MRFLVPEEATDLADTGEDSTLNAFVDELVRASTLVAECSKCRTIALIDKDYNIKLYAPVSN